MANVRDESQYLAVMMAKLIDALLRKGSEHDGNWGFPDFYDELRQMRESLSETDALKKYPKTFTI